MASIKHMATGEVFQVEGSPHHAGGVWECGDQRFTDPDGTAYEIVPEVQSPPTVGPIAFQLLWTADERVAIEDLRALNKYVANFMKLLDDPRTDVVVLALPSIQSQIRMTLDALENAGAIPADSVEQRFEQIMSGVVQ